MSSTVSEEPWRMVRSTPMDGIETDPMTPSPISNASVYV